MLSFPQRQDPSLFLPFRTSSFSKGQGISLKSELLLPHIILTMTFRAAFFGATASSIKMGAVLGHDCLFWAGSCLLFVPPFFPLLSSASPRSFPPFFPFLKTIRSSRSRSPRNRRPSLRIRFSLLRCFPTSLRRLEKMDDDVDYEPVIPAQYSHAGKKNLDRLFSKGKDKIVAEAQSFSRSLQRTTAPPTDEARQAWVRRFTAFREAAGCE